MESIFFYIYGLKATTARNQKFKSITKMVDFIAVLS